MKQLPIELTEALDVTMPIGMVKRVEHQFKPDGSPCSTHKDSCLCIMRIEDGWFYKCHRCGMRGKVSMTEASPSQATEIISKMHLESPPDSVYNGMYYNEKPADTKPVFQLWRNSANEGVPAAAVQWLLKHRIEHTAASKYDIGWSNSYQRIIFPIKASSINDVLDKGWSASYGWIGRNIGREVTKDNPKWLKRVRVVSDSVHYHAIGKYSGGAMEKLCVLVEDAVSAIRVAEALGSHSIALLGTTFPRVMLKKLAELNIVIWLDADAYTKGLRMWANLNKLGYMCRHLYTDNDPKTYSDDKIREYVTVT